MKKILGILAVVLFVQSCNDATVAKPDNLISKDQMIDIYYEVALYDAIKTVNARSLHIRKIDSTDYIYKRFGVDSLQVATSNSYYASNLDEYAEMFKTVEERLEKNFKVADSLKQFEVKKKPVDSIKPINNKLFKQYKALPKKLKAEDIKE